MKARVTNNFAKVQAKMTRANGMAVVAIGEQVVVETKLVTHVDFGTLRRSVHAAPVGYDGSRDEEVAKNSDMGAQIAVPTATPTGGAQIEVGSWLSYACAEWVGRGHPGLEQGLENARGKSDAIVFGVYKSLGL